MGRRNSSQTILHFWATWKMPKQILSWQSKFNEFLQTCLLARSNVPISLLERNLWSYWKCQTFDGKIWPFFMTSKIRDLFSLIHICTIRPTIRISVHTFRILVMYTLSYNCLKCLVNRCENCSYNLGKL